MPNDSKTISLKPHKVAFFLPAMLAAPLILLIVFTAIYWGIKSSGGEIGSLRSVFGSIIFAISGITYWLVSIKYRKTSYILSGDKIIYKTGTIFSDKELELPIRNITYLKLELPYISHLLFGIGNVYVESAGSNDTEGKLFAISNSREIYEEVQKMMKNNGFSLEKKELKEELRPHPLAVVMETIKFVLSAVFAIFYIGLSIWAEDENSEIEISDGFIDIATVIGFVTLGFIVLFAIFRYLDLRKRVYKVYNDTVEYAEGFLTKNYSLIPFENLTDSLSTQTFVDRIFGLHDVELSCPGAKREIKFKNIVGGDELAKSVGNLIKDFKKTNKKTKNPAKKTKNLRAENFSTFDTSYFEEFRMNKTRAFAWPLGLLLFAGILSATNAGFIGLAVFAGFAFIQKLILVSCTKYKISPESVDYNYKFLSAQNISFVNEKITSVILRESWIDKIFGTCQIHFGSIGSAQKIKFMHLKKTENLYENVLGKFGFINEKVEKELVPSFTIGNFAKSSFFFPIWILFAGIVFLSLNLVEQAIVAKSVFMWLNLGILIFIVLPIFIYMKFYYKRSRIFFHKNYLSVKKGLLVQIQAYSSYANIKNITTVKYPLTTAGMVKFDVAGENATNVNMSQEAQMVKSVSLGQRSTQIVRTSHILSLSYIMEIPLLNSLLDKILEKPMSSNEIEKLSENLAGNPIEEKMLVSPSLKNYLWFPILVVVLLTLIPVLAVEDLSGHMSLLFIPIVIMSPIILIIIWNIKMISFVIQDFRVIRRSGIFYRKQISILYAKIDHINKSEGFWNKIFKNGTVDIHTVGSSKVEMGMNNLNEFREFYKEIKDSL